MYRDFRVGDLAFFLFSDITGVFEQVFPDEVRAKLSDQGVYAYFAWVEDPRSRRILRAACEAWWKENSGKMTVSPKRRPLH
jgi:hypothetical protein